MIKNEYQIDDALGNGFYGKSYKCRHKSISDDLVLQEILLSNLAKSEKEDVLEEAALITKLKHPNIVQCHRFFIDKNYFCSVCKYIDGVSLKDKIQGANGTFFDENTILNWFVQICFAVKYIHDNNILHRNLHLSNMILTDYGVIKLNGFQYAKILDHSPEYPNANYGTPYNLCPETCLGLPYTTKSDIWALGIILYQLCTLDDSNGFNSLISSSLLIQNSPISSLNEGEIDTEDEIAIPDLYSNDLKMLIRTLVDKNQDHRPSINQIINHEIIRERCEDSLKTFLTRLEMSTPSSDNSSKRSSLAKRPNLGRKEPSNKKEIQQRFAGKKKPPITQPKSSNPKKLKKKTENEILSNPSIAAVGAAGVPVETLSINAVSIDPASFKAHKPAPKYDVMQSKASSTALSEATSYEDFSSLSSSSSVVSREEFYDMRRKEIKRRQKEKELERQQKMEELAQEAKQRKKELQQKEAPFKKIREMSEAAKNSDHAEDMLYIALDAAKPTHSGFHKAINAEEREQEVVLIAAMINQKRDEVQNLKKKMMENADDDVIMIGHMEYQVDKPKYPSKKQTSGSSTNRSQFHFKPLIQIPLIENNDLVQICAIFKSALFYPPDDNEEIFKSSSPSHETGLFYFNNLPLDIPGADMCTPLERADCLTQFITQGLGEELFEQARNFLSNVEMLNSIEENNEMQQTFRNIFSNNEELKYYPFAQHLVFCENYS